MMEPTPEPSQQTLPTADQQQQAVTSEATPAEALIQQQEQPQQPQQQTNEETAASSAMMMMTQQEQAMMARQANDEAYRQCFRMDSTHKGWVLCALDVSLCEVPNEHPATIKMSSNLSQDVSVHLHTYHKRVAHAIDLEAMTNGTFNAIKLARHVVQHGAAVLENLPVDQQAPPLSVAVYEEQQQQQVVQQQQQQQPQEVAQPSSVEQQQQVDQQQAAEQQPQQQQQQQPMNVEYITHNPQPQMVEPMMMSASQQQLMMMLPNQMLPIMTTSLPPLTPHSNRKKYSPFRSCFVPDPAHEGYLLCAMDSSTLHSESNFCGPHSEIMKVPKRMAKLRNHIFSFHKKACMAIEQEFVTNGQEAAANLAQSYWAPQFKAQLQSQQQQNQIIVPLTTQMEPPPSMLMLMQQQQQQQQQQEGMAVAMQPKNEEAGGGGGSDTDLDAEDDKNGHSHANHSQQQAAENKRVYNEVDPNLPVESHPPPQVDPTAEESNTAGSLQVMAAAATSEEVPQKKRRRKSQAVLPDGPKLEMYRACFIPHPSSSIRVVCALDPSTITKENRYAGSHIDAIKGFSKAGKLRMHLLNFHGVVLDALETEEATNGLYAAILKAHSFLAPEYKATAPLPPPPPPSTSTTNEAQLMASMTAPTMVSTTATTTTASVPVPAATAAEMLASQGLPTDQDLMYQQQQYQQAQPQQMLQTVVTQTGSKPASANYDAYRACFRSDPNDPKTLLCSLDPWSVHKECTFSPSHKPTIKIPAHAKILKTHVFGYHRRIGMAIEAEENAHGTEAAIQLSLKFVAEADRAKALRSSGIQTVATVDPQQFQLQQGQQAQQMMPTAQQQQQVIEMANGAVGVPSLPSQLLPSENQEQQPSVPQQQ